MIKQPYGFLIKLKEEEVGMGLMNNLVDAAKKNIMASKEEAQRQAECNKDRSINLNISFGYKEIGVSSMTVMRQKNDGTTYFGYNDSELNTFRLVGYEWGGPAYDNILTSNTRGQTATETTKKGKSGKMATGALIGTALLPGVGTMVGAAIGAGGKGKEKTSSTQNSNTHQISTQQEKNTTAILKLQRVSDGLQFAVTVTCNSNTDSQLRCFVIDSPRSTSAISQGANDALKGIKALKELYDMGAITEEEFESKKKQMLQL